MAGNTLINGTGYKISGGGEFWSMVYPIRSKRAGR